MKPQLFFLLIFLLPIVSADTGQNDWSVDTDFRSGVELAATQVFPADSVPLGSQFRISINAWSDVGALEELSFSMLEVTHGCTIMFQTTDASEVLQDRSINADAVLRMDAPTCTWKRMVYANDTVFGNVAEIRAVGTISASSAAAGIFALDGMELLAIISIMFLAVFFWSRSTDEAIKVYCSLLVVVAGYALVVLPGAAWDFAQTFGVITMIMGAYMLLRFGIDEVRTRSET